MAYDQTGRLGLGYRFGFHTVMKDPWSLKTMHGGEAKFVVHKNWAVGLTGTYGRTGDAVLDVNSSGLPIYREPADVALVAKPEMKERLLYLAERLLQRGHFVEFATHDETYVRRFVDGIVPKVGARPEQFEVQMLYGVPRERLLQELVSRGIRARLYVPFALGWGMAIAYLRRRLDEYPAMMFLVAKNTLLRG